MSQSHSATNHCSGERTRGLSGLQESEQEPRTAGTLAKERPNPSGTVCLSPLEGPSCGREMAELGTWEWNITTGQIALNRTGARMLGYSTDEVDTADLWWNQLVHPNDKYRVLRELQALLQGRTRFYATEHRIRTKTDDWICIRHAGQVVQYDSEGAPLRMFGTYRVAAPSDETIRAVNALLGSMHATVRLLV